MVGNTRHLVVLSREPGYRKKPANHLGPLLRLVYRRYPKLVEALLTRHERYNRALELVERMEKEGAVMILRPQEKPRVSRLSHDPAHLTALFEQGLRDTERHLNRLRALIRSTDAVWNPFMVRIKSLGHFFLLMFSQGGDRRRSRPVG